MKPYQSTPEWNDYQAARKNVLTAVNDLKKQASLPTNTEQRKSTLLGVAALLQKTDEVFLDCVHDEASCQYATKALQALVSGINQPNEKALQSFIENTSLLVDQKKPPKPGSDAFHTASIFANVLTGCIESAMAVLNISAGIASLATPLSPVGIAHMYMAAISASHALEAFGDAATKIAELEKKPQHTSQDIIYKYKHFLQDLRVNSDAKTAQNTLTKLNSSSISNH